MKSFMSLLAVLAVWLLPIIVKAVREVKNPTVKPTAKGMPDESEEEPDFTAEKTASDLPNYGSKLPKEPEYFTYERDNAETEMFTERARKTDKNSSQVVDNENENNGPLTLDEEEIYKGIIYSEILKKKFN